jgi:hypothetical protein
MNITSQVQVKIFHWYESVNNRRRLLHPLYQRWGPCEGWRHDSKYRFPKNCANGLTEPNCCCGFSFAKWCRRDGGYIIYFPSGWSCKRFKTSSLTLALYGPRIPTRRAICRFLQPPE